MSKGSRGRGRGRGGISLNIEAIGFGRGEQLPTPALQPPPLYPPLRKQPIPLQTGDEVNYLLALKKEFVETMQNSQYYIRAEVQNTDVVRYSDKYRSSVNTDCLTDWEPDWRRYPKELIISVCKKRKLDKSACPNLAKSKLRKKDDVDIKSKLDDLEKKDTEQENKLNDMEDDQEESGDEQIDGADFEEDDEEENDYLASYFDNGESYLDEEDENLDDKEGGSY